MPDKYVLVEHSSAINTIIHNTFQTTQRIKFTTFDVSPKYIVFGANSGGIYIFTRDPCQFHKLIPSTHGATNLVHISPNQENLAIAVSTGLVILLEDCFNPNFEQQVFTEHEGHTVTAMRWNGNDLYCGDSAGVISVITLKSFLTKAMFQTPVAVLMHLDSQIVQLDTHSKFLLVSTQTRSLLCDTESERYRQIGKKMRDGLLGACFLNCGELLDVNSTSRVWGTFQTVSDNEQLPHFANNTNVKIYCARPGARLWQADFQGNVVVTHQFRATLTQKHSDIIKWGDEDKLKLLSFEQKTMEEGFNFGKIFSVLDQFILSFNDNGIYIFDPCSSGLLHWTTHLHRIKDIKIVNNFLYVWHNDLELSVLSLFTIEELVLRSLIRKKYTLCGELCTQFFDEIQNLVTSSRKIHLISALESKLHSSEMLEKLAPIFARLKECARTLSLDKFKNGMVTVNALPILPESVQNFETEEEQKPAQESLTILSEQFKISQIEKNVETTDFLQLLERLNPDSLYELIGKFQAETKDENCDPWCKEIFLNNMKSVNCSPQVLDYACQAFLQINHHENLVCKCNFPLPVAHQTIPKCCEMGLKLMKKTQSYDLFLKQVPYMNTFVLKNLEPETIPSKIPLMIQFSDPEIIEIHSTKITYDVWDESIKLLLKLKTGQCLNCNSSIDTTASFDWTDFGTLMICSINSTNAIKLLKRYSNLLPKGELDQFFYQYCILSAVVDTRILNVKQFCCDQDVTREVDTSVGEFLRKKYLRGSDYYEPPSHNSVQVGNCDHCHLPLKIPVFEEVRKLTCGHKYHKVCFLYTKGRCALCGPIS
ncbi:BLOC-2 complex member HPS5 homolog [Zophobas morio]|uniref:BLOC-2 complex member HPS5 homolog n=1 Tax=Zophobas morio TaxID=2755281 RepID=UPI0030829855